MTIDEAVKKLCEAPSCLSKSKAKRVLEEYGRARFEAGFRLGLSEDNNLK